MDFAKLLRDAFRETIGFVGACIFYVVAPLRWPRRWAERASDPNTPSTQGYLETRLFFFLSVAAWIVFIHVFLPPPGTGSIAPTREAVEAQRQQILDSFVQAFAGGMRGAAATGLVLGGVVATAILEAWLRLRGRGRASSARIDLVVVALGVMNVYVFLVARVGAYVGKDGIASLLASISRAAVEMQWPTPVEMLLSVGAGGVTRNLVLVCVMGVLALLHIAMAWVLASPLRMAVAEADPAAAAAAPSPPAGGGTRAPMVVLALAGFAAVCAGMLAAEAIREGQPRLGEIALLPAEAAGGARGCVLVTTLVNESERPVLVTRAHSLDLRLRVGRGDGQWSQPIQFEGEVARINGRAEDALLVRPGETVLVASGPLRLVRPGAGMVASILQRGVELRAPASLETWLSGGGRALRLAPVLRPATSVAACLGAPAT
ncbi:MAG: hypothetical protein JNK67_21830 [Alphaproteobacteria bacterium]|nr:hypothetical protein [Alphaproteobacteria bacterium]